MLHLFKIQTSPATRQSTIIQTRESCGDGLEIMRSGKYFCFLLALTFSISDRCKTIMTKNVYL